MTDSEWIETFLRLDSEGYQEPYGFDYHQMSQRLRVFSENLSATLGTETALDLGNQESTFFGKVVLYRNLPVQEQCELVASSFGSLIRSRNEQNLAGETLQKIEAVARKHGFQLVPEHVTLLPYSGLYPNEFETWSHRFFDYL